MHETMRIGVVTTTYNAPLWLQHVLEGYAQQTDRNFTVIVADDGSGEPTRQVIEAFQARGCLDLQHVWHEDDGFRKPAIVNKAVALTDCPYLVFTDGDCIPRRDFVAVHRCFAQPGVFLSGGYIKLTMEVSRRIAAEDIRSGCIFDAGWLLGAGQPRSRKLWKLTSRRWLQVLLDRVTTTRATWNGMNSSAFTSDIVAVNGFNEDLQYFGDDREMGERLWNHGMKSRQIRHRAVCLHLDHARPYRKPEFIRKNDAIRAEVRKRRIAWTGNGIVKGAAPGTER